MEKLNKVSVKGMVCQRCITSVKEKLSQAGIKSEKIELGEVILTDNIADHQIEALAGQLEPLGFTIVKDKKRSLVNAVKRLVEEVYSGNFDFPYNFRFSTLATNRLQKDYETISYIFSSIENQTIEKYIIAHRISKVKELLTYTNANLSDISFRLGFSSVAHLSRQFKEQTGFSTTKFRFSIQGMATKAAA